jgi:hypothetical protein
MCIVNDNNPVLGFFFMGGLEMFPRPPRPMLTPTHKKDTVVAAILTLHPPFKA